ncbi:MAG: hypothetical protein LBR44_05935 [Clostridiales Family XIII bacterium]|jgi:hypothetical protein|nr:hypothetical protein [Clostridiales Family XIII bacterium]
MKRTITILLAAALLLVLACACGKDAGGDSAAGGDSGAATAAADAPKNGGGTVAVDISGAGAGDSAEAAETAAASGDGADAVAEDASLLDIGEKMFVGQMNDIYANTADYIGKTIRYEGFYVCYQPETYGDGEDVAYHCIVRNGPGCCGYDATVGFEFFWDGEMPQDDDWCRITGVVDTYQENGFDYIVVKATDLEVLPVRGNDTVTQ